MKPKTTAQLQKQRKQRFSENRMPSLSLSNYSLLEALFEQKGWEMDPDRDISLFSKFINTLNLLDDKQQQFLIELTKEFLWIMGSEYTNNLILALEKLYEAVGEKKIFFIKCMPLEDYGLEKSSGHVLYGLDDYCIRQQVDLGDYQKLDYMHEANENMLLSGEAVLVMVDDFIGTGDTASKTIADIHKTYPRLTDNNAIKLLAIVTQDKGYDRMTDMGVEVFYAQKVGKGIDDQNISDEEKYRKITLMEGIERKIKDLEDKYKFGYKKSEALVSMIKCPNNTFPIYWYLEGISPYERKH